MMRIAGLERRLQTIGKIRLGDQVVAANGKKRPHVLDKPRLTTSNPVLLQEAAQLYGGTVKPWDDAPAGPRQWELYVEVDAIPILIPPMDTLSQCYEVWSAKGCLRRCDSQTVVQSQTAAEIGQPCRCPVDPEERQTLAATGQACKLTTRISCMLPDLKAIGLWVIETHSYYASLWTAGMVEFLEGLAKQGRVCEAILRIERQTRKGKHGVRHFSIPTIMPQQMTPRQLFAQEMHQALSPGAPLPARIDERQKSLPEHIGDLCGEGTVDMRTGLITPSAGEDGLPYIAQIEAAIAAQRSDAEPWYVWAERKYRKGRGAFSVADWEDFLQTVQATASKLAPKVGTPGTAATEETVSAFDVRDETATSLVSSHPQEAVRKGPATNRKTLLGKTAPETPAAAASILGASQGLKSESEDEDVEMDPETGEILTPDYREQPTSWGDRPNLFLEDEAAEPGR